MTQVAIEELLKQCGSVYKLVLLAAKRAKELADGAPPLVDSGHRKVTSIALEEILHGRVLYKTDDHGASAKGRRAAKKDEKKRKAS